MTMAVYKNTLAPIEDRVADLLARMTLEEKVGQMMQLPADDEANIALLEEWHIGSYLHASGTICTSLQQRALNSRLGIPLLFGIDAIHGHCFEDGSVVFPSQLAMACSWDTELLREAGRITASEVRASGMHWTFSPVLCLGRDTRWGRVGETFGEDPWLVGELAAAMIEGYQGDDLSGEDAILACAKHYVAYGEALGGRDAYEVNLSKRQLKSLFLPPFEKAVKSARAATLMTAYQTIDGLACSANKWLLQNVAKDTWDMDGFIVTDWNNIGSLVDKQGVAQNLKEAAYQGLLAGNDMIMNTPSFFHDAIALVNEGRIGEARIDDSVQRILRCKFRLGLFDEGPENNKRKIPKRDAKSWHASLEASRRSIVLLKNDNLLPINAKTCKKILVVGANANCKIAQLGDWSFGPGSSNLGLHSAETVTLLSALTASAAQNNFSVEYVAGAAPADNTFNEVERAAAAAANADLVIACVGDTQYEYGEYFDRANLTLSGHQQALLEAVKATDTKLAVVFIASKPLAIPWVKDNADAILCAFNPGPKAGVAMEEILFGRYNPSGKLTISFPHCAGQLPVYYNKYSGWHAALAEQLDMRERYVDLPEEPVFSFGFGLSYTAFRYSNLSVVKPVLKKDEHLEVTVVLTNIGERRGVEITQVYVNDLVSSVSTPMKELKAFARAELEAGESAQLRFSLSYDDLSLVNTELERVVELGSFELMIGASSRDEDLLSATFDIVE